MINITGPTGSGRFGTSVVALPNGNFVVTDPLFDNGPIQDVGAVYLYDGTTLNLISTLTGSSTSDQVGSGTITVLPNGNFLVPSSFWDNGGASDAGAVTLVDGTTGLNGVVSASNSLVGTTSSDLVGSGGVAVLTNGNYVVRSPNWDNGAIFNAGAVTWGNGTSGVTGTVSASNSLVGTTDSDQVGSNSVTALTNGNYVVSSPNWDNGAIFNAGAVTWGNGTTGIAGSVSASNSLVGTTDSDQVGSIGVTALTNGNYVVKSPIWDNGAIPNAGAATWGNGATGITGPVSASNSLVGTFTSDLIGNSGVTELTNGNYVVSSAEWDNGAIADVGAVTWANGATGISGAVTTANSLYGTTASDRVGSGSATALTNGNYVVRSSSWDNGTLTDAGAVTWANGATGLIGPVSASNSLIGTSVNDNIGIYLTALTNGNYVTNSPNWDNGAVINAGAVTWADGTTGITGPVSASNSLVGTTANDNVGNSLVTALTNGNYVVRSQNWDNGSVINAGAVTWGNGTTGITGPVTASNSLVGTTASDLVGSSGVMALTNGNYVVRSSNWDNGAVVNAGAVTWADGSTGAAGPVTASNSLYGTTTNDFVGNNSIAALTNGHYVVRSSSRDNGAIVDAGAVTWGNGLGGTVGPVDASNSVIGNVASQGTTLVFVGHSASSRIFVGKRFENLVTVFDPFAPSSAGVEVSGRVVSLEGAGIGQAAVVMTDSQGNLRQTITSSFGYYSFEGVAAGETYIIGVRSKAFQFEPRVLEVTEGVSGVDFIAAPGSEGGRR
ncbi:MAG: carboxypeptidase regulatory-like domain-containing protein [Acidobacteria bacterium]|nr:carboxypeptidase regulatory-like domain-containing protein [Acidobacteriota bacterium]